MGKLSECYFNTSLDGRIARNLKNLVLACTRDWADRSVHSSLRRCMTSGNAAASSSAAVAGKA